MRKRFGKASDGRGFSLIETMVAVGIMGAIGYFVASLFQVSLKNSTQSNVSVQADTFKRNLINALANDSAWANTVNASAALANASPALTCLKPLYANPASAATCPAGTTTSLPNSVVVMNGGPGGGSPIYDNSSPQNGFSSSGAACNTYSASGNDLCPFQMSLTVKVTCAGSPCSNPQVEIIGALAYSPVNQAFKVALNAAKYGFDFIRGQQAESLQAACAMLGGTYVGGPPADCTLNYPYSQICVGMGGNWVNQACQFAGVTATQTAVSTSTHTVANAPPPNNCGGFPSCQDFCMVSGVSYQGCQGNYCNCGLRLNGAFGGTTPVGTYCTPACQ